jgi:hypothetical protein
MLENARIKCATGFSNEDTAWAEGIIRRRKTASGQASGLIDRNGISNFAIAPGRIDAACFNIIRIVACDF